nr:MAG TPA: hypothetical protein [Microviridae sp.]
MLFFAKVQSFRRTYIARWDIFANFAGNIIYLQHDRH